MRIWVRHREGHSFIQHTFSESLRVQDLSKERCRDTVPALGTLTIQGNNAEMVRKKLSCLSQRLGEELLQIEAKEHSPTHHQSMRGADPGNGCGWAYQHDTEPFRQKPLSQTFSELEGDLEVR